MNKKLKSILSILFYFVVLFAAKPPLARAYLDPGSGSYFIQILVASGLSMGIFYKSLLKYIKNFYNSKIKKSPQHVDEADEK